jgi:hypothetical protein
VVSGAGIYRLSTSGEFNFAPGLYNHDLNWIFEVNDAIPGELNLEIAAGDAELNLTSLALESLSFTLGAGQSTVFLPEQGGFDAKIDLAVGSVTIYVPNGLAIRINSDTGLTAISVPDGYQKQGDQYISPGYSSSSNRVELTISNAVGTVVIEEK